MRMDIYIYTHMSSMYGIILLLMAEIRLTG